MQNAGGGKGEAPARHGATRVEDDDTAHGTELPAAFDLGRCVVGEKHKLIYNALWQLPYWPVDFAGDEMWKELVQLHKDGKLAPELAKLYFSPTRPMFELYDLAADPHEMKNLASDPQRASTIAEMKSLLKAAFVEMPVRIPAPPRLPRALEEIMRLHEIANISRVATRDVEVCGVNALQKREGGVHLNDETFRGRTRSRRTIAVARNVEVSHTHHSKGVR